ncbi:hypothetical protein [Afifella pfennigii]|uniref:hypothetical protein n=1 Tax=Afifella pfennigii TaxID=209897 RepID=UPI0005589AD1|nr:hypothetical protein [Afifella pfennigii]
MSVLPKLGRGLAPALMATAAGLTATAVAYAALGDRPQIAASEPPAKEIPGLTEVRLRFEPDGDPRAGRVKVLLRPESRPLTYFEARQAVRQAFLETLKEPGLPDDLKRIAVTVEMQPEGAPGGETQTYLFVRKDAKTWTILAPQP